MSNVDFQNGTLYGLNVSSPGVVSGFTCEADFVVLDHTPTEEDIETSSEYTLFVVYDINETAARWGASAYDIANEQGYQGTKEQYNDSLSQVGNMGSILDFILGER